MLNFSLREAQASSSEGEEKKPGQGASAAENLPEMSADSKQILHTISVNDNVYLVHLCPILSGSHDVNMITEILPQTEPANNAYFSVS